jgi:hypothetical protein
VTELEKRFGGAWVTKQPSHSQATWMSIFELSSVESDVVLQRRALSEFSLPARRGLRLSTLPIFCSPLHLRGCTAS